MKALIHGYFECYINEEQNKVMYGGEWNEILEDIEGEPYFICDEDAIYFEVIE